MAVPAFALLAWAGSVLATRGSASKEDVKQGVPRVAQLLVYPIKSCPGMSVLCATVTSRGLVVDDLVRDRSLLVCTRTTYAGEGGQQYHRMCTQREFPAMVHIEPSWDGHELEIRIGGVVAGSVALGTPPSDDADRVYVRIWDDIVPGVVCGDTAVHEKLSGLLHRDVLLVRGLAEVPRAAETSGDHIAFPETPGSVPYDAGMYADGYPYLVTSTASHALLEQRLSDRGVPIDDTVRRFRPNVIVTGVPAHGEDDVSFFAAENGVVLAGVKPCARCSLPTVSAQGKKDGAHEPIATLEQYRAWDGEVWFGQNAVLYHGEGGSLSVGDLLSVSSLVGDGSQ